RGPSRARLSLGRTRCLCLGRHRKRCRPSSRSARNAVRIRAFLQEVHAMTTLTIYPDKDPANPITVTSDPAEIGAELNKVGVLFERWKAGAELAPDASHEDILAAYKAEVDRLSAA